MKYEVDQVIGAPLLSLAPNQTMALTRIALRDNGLFDRLGSFDVHMHKWPFARVGTTALLRPTGPGADTVFYWDNGDTFANSKLTFVTPEPSTLAVLTVAGGALLARRKRKR